jgi:Bacterial TSP3 repeat
VERRDIASGTWIALPGVVPASGPPGTPTVFNSADVTALPGRGYSYRIRYTFGNMLSPPSLPASVALGIDTDGDGIADSSDDDDDGDGMSDSEEVAAGTDPKRKDNPLLFLSAFGITQP